MASLAHAIHGVQKGTLSHYEFLQQVDRLLEEGQTDSTQLHDLLNEERTRILLPPDVYAELRNRADHAPLPGASANAERTVAQTVRSAPFIPSTNPAATSPPTASTIPPTASWRDVVSGEPEKMKGVGDTLNNRFVLEECIGFGGMGMVYRALDLRKLEASDRNPYIAIKVLNVQFRGHPKSLIALQREAKKAQTLAHPNIVTVYDFDRDGPTVYLTMEFLSGEPLSRMLRHPDFKGLPLADTQRIVTGMARALAYAHERGFVHCDFKPANVILTDAGDVKVIDFGIARAFRKPSQESEVTVFDPGSLGGLTPAYASPEMLEHREPDPRDDIYALACITYELLTGKHPFDRLTASQARNAAMKPQRPKDLGQRQWKALKSALAFERDARTSTIARFLEEFGDGRKPANQVAMIASGAAALLLAIGGAGYYLASRGGGEGQKTAAVSSGGSTTETVCDRQIRSHGRAMGFLRGRRRMPEDQRRQPRKEQPRARRELGRRATIREVAFQDDRQGLSSADGSRVGIRSARRHLDALLVGRANAHWHGQLQGLRRAVAEGCTGRRGFIRRQPVRLA
jgi:predicted Ser/Thr protein kinase